ncbi:hypothetical protein BY458DRAFT_498833 [Sporodiniella umbellata]|nr:hypothetical protein BY458DRAFT_498833 [Sporodiniella umbellata]
MMSEKDDNEKTETPYSVFTKNQKIAITATVSLSAFFSPFTTNIYFPALHIIQKVNTYRRLSFTENFIRFFFF